jgi:1,4-alpha-glucan branching enzyme
MRRAAKYILVLLLLLSGWAAHAQNRNKLTATRTQLVLRIDLNSTAGDIDTLLKSAGITGANGSKLLKGDFSVLTNDGWKEVKNKNGLLQFNHPLKDLKNNPPDNSFTVTREIVKVKRGAGYMGDAIYGVNDFTRPSVTELPSGFTRFILPGYLNAKRAFLSGGFNNWSTLEGKMTKTTTGWSIDIKLAAGAYMYKFIVDGRWMTDPNNALDLDDGDGHVNSVYYKYNHTFKLTGFPAAKKVTVAGSFNNWNNTAINLQKEGNIWECPLYLREGAYDYRFYVDGKAMTDPANRDQHKEDDGTISSVITIGQTIYFKLSGYSNAHNVQLAGNFNNWNAQSINLKKSGNEWLAQVVLPSGNYQYKFVVDGQWITDPANPAQAVENDQINSFLAVNPNYTFKLPGYPDAHAVHLAGNFNQWNPAEYFMGHKNNEWSISMYLPPGKCLYKFIVDGNWMLDPGNKTWEQNQYHTGNSVFWIE